MELPIFNVFHYSIPLVLRMIIIPYKHAYNGTITIFGSSKALLYQLVHNCEKDYPPPLAGPPYSEK